MQPDTDKWLVVLLGLILGILAGPVLRVGSAHAESSDSKGIELMTRATKTYEAGAYGDSAALIEAAFKAGLTGETAARAILLRAQINEKNGALARALQDYSNALWMDVLGAQDRRRAADGKERVMAAMGLSSPAPAAPAPRPQPVVASAAPSSAPPVQHAEASSGGVLSYFSGIFGSSEAKPEPAAAQPQRSAQPSSDAKPSAAPQKNADKAPAKPTPVKVANASKPASASAQAAAQPASALSVAEGPEGFLIVFGTASNESSGRTTAKNIKAELSDILINRNIDVARKSGGGFQVQAGPYKTKKSALALCSVMAQRGVPCQVMP